MDAMAEPGVVDIALARRIESREERWLWLVYVSYALLVPAAIGALVSALRLRALRRLPAPDGHHAATTHHRWLLTTFVAGALAVPVAIGTIYYGVGVFVAIGAAVWWTYRLVRGMRALVKHEALPILV